MHNQNSLLKSIIRRFSAFLLVLFILLPTLPVISFEDGNISVKDIVNPLVNAKADAATVASGNGTWIADKLTYTWEATSNGSTSNGATGTVSASGNTLTVTATNSKKVSGCTPTAAEATTTTVTVTNESSYPLKFTKLNTDPDVNANVSGVNLGDTIDSGKTFVITVNAAAKDDSTKVTGTVTVSVEEMTAVTITLKSSPYVSYTVGGKTVEQNGKDQTFDADAGSAVSLPSISAPSGYKFAGWRVGSSLINATSFTAGGSYDVFPAIVSSSAVTTGDNFKYGSNTYTFWEDAVKAAVLGGGGKLIVNKDFSLPANVLDNTLPAAGGTYVKPKGDGVEYIVPNGVTLLVPFDTSGTLYTTTPTVEKSHTMQSRFCTLTMPAGTNITVNSGGAISLSSKLSTKDQLGGWNGTPTGPYGHIHMASDSNITVKKGGNLYCWGYIDGAGEVDIESGATVYEAFQIKDWRGGTSTSSVYNYAFIFSQYYIQNIEVPLKIYSGATEKLYSSLNASSTAYPIGATLIGGSNSGALFRITSGYIVKDYNENKDRIEYHVNGNAEIDSMTITGIPMIGSISTGEYMLPINGNMTIDIESGSTVIKQDMELLPGGTVSVQKNATVTVNTNTSVYLYDKDNWDNFTGSAKLYVVGYSVANGTTTVRTASNLEDAHVVVNGTMQVNGSLYTSAAGADITSETGFDVSTNGKLVFGKAPTAEKTIYECKDNSTKTAVTMYAPKVHNGDDSYSSTAGTGTSTWKYDKPGEHWYRYLVNFKFNGNLIDVGYFCENGATVTYDASWLYNLGATASNGTATVSGSNVNVTGVTADSTVTLTGEPYKYIPTFVLNEKQYGLYQAYTGNNISDTVTINDATYYVVQQASEPIEVGTSHDAPTDATMGVTGKSGENHNELVWNMSGISFTSGDPFRGIVPAGTTHNDPVYIYGFYDGFVAYVSYTDDYYVTLNDAFSAVPTDQTSTIKLLLDCGSYAEEKGTTAHNVYPEQHITLDLNGHKALGRIINNGNLTLELNGGTLEYKTGATAAAAGYKGMAAIINNGTLTVQDSVGTGKITLDASSNATGTDGTAVIRNNAGATLAVIGKDADHLLPLETTQNYANGNYGIFNLGTITDLTYVDMTTANSGTVAVNLYNYNTGVVNRITGGHMYSYTNYSVFNYGSEIGTIDGLSIDGKYGVLTRNIRGSARSPAATLLQTPTGVSSILSLTAISRSDSTRSIITL